MPATPVAQSWLKQHETLLIVLMILLALIWGYTKYADLNAAKAEARATAAEQALTAQKTQDTVNATTTASVLSQYQAMVNAQTAKISSLQLIVAQRQASVKVQQKADANLAIPALAARLQTVGNVPAGQVSATPNSVILTQPGAVAVVQTLETIPALQANLQDETALAEAAQAAQAQGDKVILAQTTEITGLKLTIGDEETQCKAQIAVVNASARKGKIKWFKIGFISGFLSGLWVGHYIP
jgi:hypothetical protein